jgi:hypothetical protein
MKLAYDSARFVDIGDGVVAPAHAVFTTKARWWVVSARPVRRTSHAVAGGWLHDGCSVKVA